MITISYSKGTNPKKAPKLGASSKMIPNCWRKLSSGKDVWHKSLDSSLGLVEALQVNIKVDKPLLG